MSNELHILDQEIYNVRDKVFYIINSDDEPTGFIICYGEIVKKTAVQLNIVYAIQLLKIISSKELMIRNFHMKRFNIQYKKSGIFSKAKYNILDIIDDINFDTKLVEKTSKVLFHSPSYLTSSSQNTIQEILGSIQKIAKTFLESELEKLNTQL